VNSAANAPWPMKTRELQNWICDSTRWNDFNYRPGDIVICTWSKAGRWRDVLTPADIEKYERAARTRLTADCAHWLATGELPGVAAA